jgi:hypothetical protein
LEPGFFAVGEKIRIFKDGCLKLPVSLKHEQEVLFVSTESGYRLIPLLPDIKRIYIEVTTKCNFACIIRIFLNMVPSTTVRRLLLTNYQITD